MGSLELRRDLSRARSELAYAEAEGDYDKIARCEEAIDEILEQMEWE